MSNELKPCPFCKETPSVGLCGDRVMHDCKTLGELIVCTVEAWNTRYEPTCHPVKDDEGWVKCSECGHELYTDFDSVSKLHVVEPYCPHCDAKVVSA